MEILAVNSRNENESSTTTTATTTTTTSTLTNATNFSNEVNVQTCTFEKMISVLQNTGYLMSFIYLLRVYYYFWTKGVYTLQKKNLLSLCVNLSALYSLLIADMLVKIPNFLVVISCCEVTTTVLLLVMSMDTCLNLRRRARNRPMPPDADDASECKLFIFYTFCSWILAQCIAYILAYTYDNFLIILIDFHLLCYTMILIMFFVSLYNIRPAATVNLGIGAGGSNRNFTIFGRTLIITFVTSSIKFAFAIIFYATGKQIDLLLLLDCLMAYDGVFIYHCLTFNNKKIPSRLHGGTSQIHIISHSHTNTNAAQFSTLPSSHNSNNHPHHHNIHSHHHYHYTTTTTTNSNSSRSNSNRNTNRSQYNYNRNSHTGAAVANTTQIHNCT